MKKLFLMLAFIIMVLFFGVNGVSAHWGHTSCRVVGLTNAIDARDGGVGVDPNDMPHSDPNTISDTVEATHLNFSNLNNSCEEK